MKRLDLDELTREVIKISYEFDTYEFKDVFESYDDAYEYTLETLETDAVAIWTYLNELSKSMDAYDFDELDYEYILKVQNKVYELCI